jgi:hypothetical protein
LDATAVRGRAGDVESACGRQLFRDASNDRNRPGAAKELGYLLRASFTVEGLENAGDIS